MNWRTEHPCAYFQSCSRTDLNSNQMFPTQSECLYEYSEISSRTVEYYSRAHTLLHLNRGRLSDNKSRDLREILQTEDSLWMILDHGGDEKLFRFGEENEFPERISLDFNQCFDFNLSLFMKTHGEQIIKTSYPKNSLKGAKL